MTTSSSCSKPATCACCAAVPLAGGPTTARAPDGPLTRSVFRIPGMDCPAEEQMIRLRLADSPVVRLDFDLPGRRLTVDHGGEAADVLQALCPLGYSAE